MAAGAGGVAALGQVPFSIVALGLAGLGLAGWLAARSNTSRRAAWIGFCAGTGYFGVTLHWIVQPFLVDAERHGWMAPFGLLFTATGFALFWALAFWLARRIAPGGGWRYALAFGGALAGVETLRSLILTGFPWSLIGYIWSEGAAVQSVAVIGPFGLTLLTGLFAGALAAIGPRWPAIPALIAAAILPPVLLSLVPPAPLPASDAPVIRLVQPNAPQDEKWHPELGAIYFSDALDASAAPGNPDLIIWPETSVPYLLEPGHPVLGLLAGAGRGAPVVVGAQRVEGPLYYNSLLVISPEARVVDTYDKHHLVPFGEYMPLGDLAARFGLRGLAQGQFGYSAGPGPRLVDLGPLGQVLPLICYEAIFPEEVGGAPVRPDWLLQITNDAWFGTFAGPQQHLAIARMRAIEQGLPLARAANTGITAMIDARGRVTASLGLGQTGALDTVLPPALPPTTYARTGDWPALVAILLSLAAALRFRRKTA
ncbi:apolipoprotein N-acyltransferase [Palleronia abyssalis]|uniref:Apolipoprotein N-acyltransferase n=1 Tax=Palleronia abyssalis TaxID=1501240 RepID=A0A2R8BW96_9RHOB|nr:apolipoprotein N-acyltransferase [Palleronia abyssalis]SPJ24415.1 Apolipoprotein N-acyltransferase [Palleronia abyssalis]